MGAEGAEQRLERVLEGGIDPVEQVRVENAQRRLFAREAGVVALTLLSLFLLNKKRSMRVAQNRRVWTGAAVGVIAGNLACDWWLRRLYLAELDAALAAHPPLDA